MNTIFEDEDGTTAIMSGSQVKGRIFPPNHPSCPYQSVDSWVLVSNDGDGFYSNKTEALMAYGILNQKKVESVKHNV